MAKSSNYGIVASFLPLVMAMLRISRWVDSVESLVRVTSILPKPLPQNLLDAIKHIEGSGKIEL